MLCGGFQGCVYCGKSSGFHFQYYQDVLNFVIYRDSLNLPSSNFSWGIFFQPFSYFPQETLLCNFIRDSLHANFQ